MADLRIVDAPLLSTVKGTEKIPTGGEGNFSVSVNQVADFAKLKWFLATEGYVDVAVGNVQADLNLHKNNSSNPHGVTKVQVGLGDVDNTADLDKPVSNATQSAIITANSGKADKSYVDSQDQLKADKTTVEASLLLKADKVDLKASKILSDGNQTQQSINDFGGAKWYAKSGGYELGATAKLENGDTVKSTVANNTINPNVDMTGWIKESEIFEKNIAFINPSKEDITQLLKDAVASNKSEYTLIEGNYTISEPIVLTKKFVLKSNKATISGNGSNLFTTSASVELHNINPKGFNDIVNIVGSQQIKKIGFYGCDLSQSGSVLNWQDTTRTSNLQRLDMLMSEVSEMSKYVITCDAKIRDIYIGGNTLTNNARYLLRRLFGDTNERYCENIYIYKNIVRGLTNGNFAGAAAVARCWQIAAERIFLLNNHYEDVTTTDIGAANCTIAYTDAKYLLVSGNTHKNCGAESSSGYLYHDKSSGGRSISNKYLSNTFEQDDMQDYNQGIIQSVALSSEFLSNTFDGVRGICSYLGWNKARNITYAFNKHLNLKGVCAVRFYGDLETINHFSNVYDGITNDKDVTDSGRRGAWFVDILKSTAELAPRSFKSSGNTYKNLSYTGEATTPIRAAIVIGSDESMDKFSVADFFHDMSVGVQFRIAAQMQTFVLDKSEFYNVANPYQFQAGASYKPANFVLGDNFGLKTKARGKITFATNQTSITVQHGLFGASASNLWMQISSSELELFRVAGPLSGSFDIRRTAAATTPTVYWEAEVIQ